MADEFRSPSRYFQVDVSAISQSLEYLDSIPTYILREISDEASQTARSLLVDEFESAMAKQDIAAFPQEFRDHVIKAVKSLPIERVVNQQYTAIDIDFGLLGTTETLKKAFHQGAVLKRGGRVDGPWDESMELLEPDAATRHVFWEAMVRGDAFYTPSRRNKKGRFRKQAPIPIPPDAWERTKQKYLDIWGAEAPEWLYLQYGQQKWEPHITPSSIVEDFSRNFRVAFEEIWDRRLTQELARISGVESSFYGGRHGYTPTGRKFYNVRNPSGQFAKRPPLRGG